MARRADRFRRADLRWIVRHDRRIVERGFWRVLEEHEWDIPQHRSDRRSLHMVREMSSVEVNGIELAYVVAGDTELPPVVLLHALGEDSNTWSTVVEALATRYRMYAVDLRGHGASSQPVDYSLELMCSDVLELVRTLHLEEVTLIGHSLGGEVAYLVTEAEPGLVRQLVLEEPPPPLPATPPRVVPSKPSDPLPFDWRVLGAIAHQRNRPDPAWWEDLNLITARTLVIAGGPTAIFHRTRSLLSLAASPMRRWSQSMPGTTYTPVARTRSSPSCFRSWTGRFLPLLPVGDHRIIVTISGSWLRWAVKGTSDLRRCSESSAASNQVSS